MCIENWKATAKLSHQYVIRNACADQIIIMNVLQPVNFKLCFGTLMYFIILRRIRHCVLKPILNKSLYRGVYKLKFTDGGQVFFLGIKELGFVTSKIS